MAVIAPNSDIEIMNNVPLNPNCQHTCTWENSTLRDTYFATKTKYLLRNYTYEQGNSILVGIPIENLYDCNYIGYKNTNFENKWFYAFIIRLEYVNNETTRITFMEDSFVTWQFDFDLQQCFVAREHVVDDTIGKNVVPEDVELGEYVVEHQDVSYVEDFDVVILAAVWVNIANNYEVVTNYTPSSAYGIYSGLAYTVCNGDAQATGALNAIAAANYIDSIVSVFCVPHGMFTTVTSTLTYNKPYTSINGYVPKNKKLFTAPYKYLRVSTGQGQNAEYPYEYFNTENGYAFYLRTFPGFPYEMKVYPASWKNLAVDYENALTITNFPVCSYRIDTFKAWYAQNYSVFLQQLDNYDRYGDIGRQRYNTAMTSAQNNYRQSLTQSGLGMLQGMMGLNPGAVVSGAASMLNSTMELANYEQELGLRMRTDYNAQVAAIEAQVKSHSINNLNAVATGATYSGFADWQYSFKFTQISITSDFAQRIDKYFDMFGYQVNTVKIPELTSRASWNYVKTVGCQITASIPQYAVQIIESLFDRGITLWHNPAWIGDYSRDNSIIGNG